MHPVAGLPGHCQEEGIVTCLKIEKPRIEDVDEARTTASSIVEPLERGYGITLGNSPAAILLSSLPGAAVTSVRIDGVLHEFSTIPGVVEDTTDIVILNLEGAARQDARRRAGHAAAGSTPKGRAKSPRLTSGAGPEVENSQPGSAHRDARRRAAKPGDGDDRRQGPGIRPAERNKRPDQPIGVIAVDSIFTPMRRVNYRVEDNRVGQMTDYDRLDPGSVDRRQHRARRGGEPRGKILTEHLRSSST